MQIQIFNILEQLMPKHGWSSNYDHYKMKQFGNNFIVSHNGSKMNVLLQIQDSSGQQNKYNIDPTTITLHPIKKIKMNNVDYDIILLPCHVGPLCELFHKPNNIVDSELFLLISEQLGKYHSITSTSTNKIIELPIWNDLINILAKVIKSENSKKTIVDIPRITNILQEYVTNPAFYASVPDSGYCHNNLTLDNIMWDNYDKKIYFTHSNTSGNGSTAYDIAILFCNIQLTEHSKKMSFLEKYVMSKKITTFPKKKHIDFMNRINSFMNLIFLFRGLVHVSNYKGEEADAQFKLYLENGGTL